MSDSIDTARETMERAHGEPSGGAARRVAVLVAILAAGLALAEMAEKAAQNEYLTHHITTSDDYAYYQAKTIRSALYTQQADILSSLPNAADPALVARAAAARAAAARMDDDVKSVGRKQLLAKAAHSEALRHEAFHSYHLFELVVSGLQIAIVLASVSVVTRVGLLAAAAALIGVVAGAVGIAVAAGAPL